MSEQEESFPAQRAIQVDADEIDRDVFDILKSQLSDVFKYFRSGVFGRYDPEINAALRFVFWKYAVNSVEATVGQQLVELRYKDVTSPGAVWMTRTQKLLHLLCNVGVPWLLERSADLEAKTEDVPFAEKFWQGLGWFEKLWKIASLINFLVFLQQGRYQFLHERLLGIRAMYPKRQEVRQVGFDFMDRELLWHGVAEFLFFLLPLINFRRVKNLMVRSVLGSAKDPMSTERTDDDYKQCVVCEEWPMNPHEFGCRHVFCYYCLMSNHKADPHYSCPMCSHVIEAAEQIQPVRIKLDVKS